MTKVGGYNDSDTKGTSDIHQGAHCGAMKAEVGYVRRQCHPILSNNIDYQRFLTSI